MPEAEAFQGVKVADFGSVLAGPIVSKILADHGATVIWVESRTNPDLSRVSSPFKDGKAGVNRSAYFNFWAANKLSMSINLKHPKGIGLAKKLVAWADIVSENRRTGAMERMGLSYDDLRKIKPDIILLRNSNQGQSGPYASHPGLGLHLNGLAGFDSIIGWPGQEPISLMMAYPDYLTPPLAIAALVAALDHRRKTGEGQMLDISQLEASLQYLATLPLNYTVNGVEAEKTGNSCSHAAPHGVFKCQGEDRWCAIAVFNDSEWKSFVRVIGRPAWTKEARFSTLLGRKQNEAELDRLIEKWTVKHTAEQVMERMQKAGVAAGVVKNAKDLCEDPQLKERGLFWEINHPEVGEATHLGEPYLMSETPARPRAPAPCLGEHTEYVCRQLLGMSEEEFDELLIAGVFE